MNATTINAGLIALAGFASLGLAAPAAAQSKPAASSLAASPAQLQSAQSELGFTSRQMGVPVEGRFKRFDAKLSFDPKKPEAAQVAFTIDLNSVALGAPELEAELAKAPWFDSKKLAQASFVSTAVKATGAAKFEVTGRLTIKGQTRDITVPIGLSQAGTATTANGGFVLKRLEFKIGDGEWADTSMVANEVQVKFKLAFTGIAAL
ncbi:YceI family protein [Paucibacter sp. AS339]|uniref:YceI family protein n=1 Tax=Paucibacter hankyongi TaxID=3133434 RepID=UPI0030A46643